MICYFYQNLKQFILSIWIPYVMSLFWKVIIHVFQDVWSRHATHLLRALKDLEEEEQNSKEVPVMFPPVVVTPPSPTHPWHDTSNIHLILSMMIQLLFTHKSNSDGNQIIMFWIHECADVDSHLLDIGFMLNVFFLWKSNGCVVV